MADFTLTDLPNPLVVGWRAENMGSFFLFPLVSAAWIFLSITVVLTPQKGSCCTQSQPWDPSSSGSQLWDIFPDLHWQQLSARSSLVYYCYLFACTRANPAHTHPCASSFPSALACMTGKMSYKQIKIETQKRTNYNVFNYLFQNHSSSLLYSVAGNVLLAIWQGHFFLPRFIPSLGGGVVSEPGRGEKLCSSARWLCLHELESQKTNTSSVSTQRPVWGVLSPLIADVSLC